MFSIHPIAGEELNLPVTICGIGSQEHQCSITRHEGYPLHQLIFSRKGSGILYTPRGKFQIKEGDYFYLKPNEEHRYESVSKRWSTDWLLFKCRYSDMLDVLDLTESKVSHYYKHIEIENLYYDIVSILQKDEISTALSSSAKLYELLVLLKDDNRNKKMSSEGIEKLLEPVIDYIDHHFELAITLESLANLIDITPQHLCKIFKEYYKLRPFEYVTKKRIQMAKKMLLETDLSIKEIAFNVGYSDNSYFGALFKKHEKTTATVYRGRRLK